MNVLRYRRTVACGLLVGAACLASVAGCDALDDLVNRITIELVNETRWDIEPELFADEEDDILFAFTIHDEENYVDVGRVPADTTVVTTLPCDEAGSLQVYRAVAIRTGTDYIADNDPIVDMEHDYDCGDQISFIFREWGDGFYVRVEVNGQFVED